MIYLKRFLWPQVNKILKTKWREKNNTAVTKEKRYRKRK